MDHSESLLASQAPPPVQQCLGHILLSAGKLSPHDMARIIQTQHDERLPFGSAAVHLGLVSQTDVEHALEIQFDIRRPAPGDSGLAPELAAAFSGSGEALRRLQDLRSALMLEWFEVGNKTLGFAGVHGQAGTSVLVANLAILLARLKLPTLLVDANLVRPRLHHLFNVTNPFGMTGILAGRAGEEAIQPIRAIPNLSLLPAGAKVINGDEMLDRRVFAELCGQLGRRFEIILVDLPSFADSAAALAAGRRLGGLFLCMRRHITTWRDVRDVSERLERGSVALAGSVLGEF